MPSRRHSPVSLVVEAAQLAARVIEEPVDMYHHEWRCTEGGEKTNRKGMKGRGAFGWGWKPQKYRFGMFSPDSPTRILKHLKIQNFAFLDVLVGSCRGRGWELVPCSLGHGAEDCLVRCFWGGGRCWPLYFLQKRQTNREPLFSDFTSCLASLASLGLYFVAPHLALNLRLSYHRFTE